MISFPSKKLKPGQMDRAGSRPFEEFSDNISSIRSGIGQKMLNWSLERLDLYIAKYKDMGTRGSKHFGILFILLAFGCSTLLAQTASPSPVGTTPTQDTGYSVSGPYIPRFLTAEQKPNSKTNVFTPSTPGTEIVDAKGPYALQVLVFDSSDRPVEGLTKDNFRVFIGKDEQVITRVEPSPPPLNVVFFMDRSPSTSERGVAIREAMYEIEQSLRPDDKVMVVEFAEKMKVVSEFTTERKKIKDVNISDGTSLYDSIDELYRTKLASVSGPTTIVLFTDGMDTTSTRTNYPLSLLEAEKSNATAIVVYVDPGDQLVNKVISSNGVSSEIEAILKAAMPKPTPAAKARYQQQYVVGKAYLNDLVSLSGGRAVIFEEKSKGKPSIANKISSWLSHQYLVTVDLSLKVRSNDRMPIQVLVERPRLMVLAKGSYYKGN